ncbi:unnamed protein product [Ectocarpus sp. CCAP 1310/34]|nr:unnamed protein product [Ectocarpus sp. CCAP 1310/34]
MMPSFDVPNSAARLTSNTRHILSRLGFGLDADDEHTGMMAANDEAENEASTEQQHRKEQLRGGEKHVTTAADELDNDNGFQEELKRVFHLAVRADSTYEREFMGTLSHTENELRGDESVDVSKWKKVVFLLCCRLTNTVFKNSALLADKNRLVAELHRTGLELEETRNLVSSLLDSHVTVDGGPGDSAVTVSAPNAPSRDQSNESFVQSATAVDGDGVDAPHSDHQRTSFYDSVNSSNGDGLNGGPVTLSMASERWKDNSYHPNSDNAGRRSRFPSGAGTLARLAKLQGQQQGERVETIIRDDFEDVAAAATGIAQTTDSPVASERSASMVITTAYHTEVSVGDPILQCFGSGLARLVSPGAMPISAKVSEIAAEPAPAPLGLEMSYLLPSKAENVPLAAARLAISRSPITVGPRKCSRVAQTKRTSPLRSHSTTADGRGGTSVVGTAVVRARPRAHCQQGPQENAARASAVSSAERAAAFETEITDPLAEEIKENIRLISPRPTSRRPSTTSAASPLARVLQEARAPVPHPPSPSSLLSTAGAALPVASTSPERYGARGLQRIHQRPPWRFARSSTFAAAARSANQSASCHRGRSAHQSRMDEEFVTDISEELDRTRKAIQRSTSEKISALKKEQATAAVAARKCSASSVQRHATAVEGRRNAATQQSAGGGSLPLFGLQLKAGCRPKETVASKAVIKENAGTKAPRKGPRSTVVGPGRGTKGRQRARACLPREVRI